MLHALHENGHIQLQDLEAHIKDDIERDSAKIAEMARKVRQSYKELTTGPVIEDDMLFAQDGQMLQHGDFAEDLGEDFLGLRELGIDKEYGLSSLSVPKALFFGRHGRNRNAADGKKEDLPDYPPPPPFVPLTPATYKSTAPSFMHKFLADRLEKGGTLEADDAFDPAQATIGPLGQVVVKAPQVPAGKKKDGAEKKKPAKKIAQPGVGKGNWIRPSKEERERRAAEKKALLEKQRLEEEARKKEAGGGGGGGEEDAEGEEE